MLRRWRKSSAGFSCLCLPGRLHAATVFHSRLRMLDRTGLGVKSGERVMLHTGTAEVQARATWVTTSNAEDGLARAIRTLLAG